MKIEKVTIEQGFNQVPNIIKEKEETIIYSIPEEINIMYGKKNEYFNEEYCLKNNFDMYDLDYFKNGAIVLFPKDLAFMLFTQKDVLKKVLKIMEIIITFLKREYNLNCFLFRNDLVIKKNDDILYKIGSFVIRKYDNGFYQAGLFVSLDINQAIINSVCNKQSKKIPFSLKEYQITAEELLEEIKNQTNNFIDILEKEEILNG